ncbi:hypothetical protein THTE_3841 [Thermogutta terrifontis]|uniref:Uncharacterized protein n=1 Tax=Thermogutta terrifontis TaxID=1331910 RepID=A0A286RKI2_9BACT|nr:hypothetical protein THTE_3841 [Thermogutta terrifontis]
MLSANGNRWRSGKPGLGPAPSEQIPPGVTLLFYAVSLLAKRRAAVYLTNTRLG